MGIFSWETHMKALLFACLLINIKHDGTGLLDYEAPAVEIFKKPDGITVKRHNHSPTTE